MSERRFYKRTWKVTAYRPKPGTPGGFINSNSSFFEPLPNGIEITKMRIQVSIEKNLDKESNTCELTISNLSDGERADLVKKPLIVRVDAGYEQDAGAVHLFTGDLRYGYSKRSGTEWETILQLGDGSRAFAQGRISKSYKSGTSVLVALRDAAASLGLKLPAAIETSSELQRQFAAGVQLHGAAADEMTRLLAPFGYTWSVQDGRMQILKDEDTRPDRAWVLSPDTGLIDDPEFGAPTKEGGTPTLTARSLLYPQLTPGGKVSVQSDSINGIFRAERVTHTLDSHGDDWTTEIESKPAT